ncbi:MAG: hypothetical protein KAJ65_00715 [Gammaproteobacteria bacterium]|nr:hypothetical protein [Gammaproteobacteria bacterium]
MPFINGTSTAAAGIAETTWNTSRPNKKGNGGTATGSYTATTSAVTVDGFTWDGTATATTFTLNP